MLKKEFDLLVSHGTSMQFEAKQAPMEQGWVLAVQVQGSMAIDQLETQRGKTRVFKTLDAVQRFVSSVGGHTIFVEW
jgi:hypothetical protein